MEELESQIAKIQLGNTKSSSTYVFVMAEKAEGPDAELYVVAELPLFNPAAEESCERICLAIAASLKRSYKRPVNGSAFENAISQINEELGKLASMGQTDWVDKLNCIVGVKSRLDFNIASCGKTAAYLLRNGEYTDISCSPEQSHPLKTFENYASGKIRLGDLLILSTTQLFNYLSMDRLLNIVGETDFLTATQTLIALLKQNADPQVSFGVLLNLQVPVGQIQESDVDLENYIVEQPKSTQNFFSSAITYAKAAFFPGKTSARIPQTDIPKISMSEKLKNIGGNTKNFMVKGKGLWQSAKTSASAVSRSMKPQNFQKFSTLKKFLLISALLMFIALGANIIIASRLKNNLVQSEQISNQLKDAQNLLSNAQASLLYKNDSQAADYIKQAEDKLPKASQVSGQNLDLYNTVFAQLTNIQKQMEKVTEPEVTNLGSLGQADSLIKLPNYAGVQINGSIISYNKQNGKIEDSVLSLPITTLDESYITGNIAAVYDGSSLYGWDFSTGKNWPGFNQNLALKANFGGMAAYSVNNRVYVADKKAGDIISYLAQKNSFSKPVVAVRDPGLSEAQDIAIDGSIYVLTSSGVSKYQNGKLADFSFPRLPTPLSSKGKIATQKDFVDIYILDPGNNRILVIDKKGNLVYSLQSTSFTKLKDFQVDEKNKTIFVLNDGNLLKVMLP